MPKPCEKGLLCAGDREADGVLMGFFTPSQNDHRSRSEAAFQWGVLGAKNILAWGTGHDTSYTFRSFRLRPQIGATALVASGNHGNSKSDQTSARCASALPRVIFYCLNAFCQGRNRGERSLEVRAFAINHVALERCITPGKSSISHKAGNGPQGLGDRVCAVSRELMAISCGIRQYDLSCQERNLSEIIVPAKHVQII
jgi:hypothetical protein